MRMKGRSAIIVISLILSGAVDCPAEQSALPNSLLMVPISSGAWQMIVYGIRTVESLKVGMGGSFGSTTVYTPKEGYAFLVVDVNISKVDPTSPMRISTDQIALLDANNGIHTADGGGCGDLVSPQGVFIVSKSIDATKNTYFSSDGKTLSTGDLYFEDPFSFVFIVRSNELNQQWRLQFQQMPLISLKLGDPVPQSPTTEYRAQSCSLPTVCDANALRTAQTKSCLFYQEWADNTLVTRSVLLDSGAQSIICKSPAYHEVAVSADGAILLQESPQRGWRNLYIIEPDGKTSSLVRNARIATGEFMPGTSYVIIKVVPAGKQGWQLYAYDRKKGIMTLLSDGTWYKYRIFPDGILLLQSTMSKALMGSVGKGTLPALTLPGGDADDITPDGKHVIVSDYIANLDGSGRRQITGGTVENAVLSPDGRYLLFQRDGTAAYTKQAFHYDLASGSTQPVTSNGNNFVSSFSPDGKWAVIIGTFQKEASDKSEAKNEVLYLIRMDDGKTTAEVHGEIESYLFSPDGAFLAYTTVNGDNPAWTYAITLATGVVQAIGQGLVTGWSASR